MKVLVYGAGPLGSLFSARLQEAGHEVSLLARDQRLADFITVVERMLAEKFGSAWSDYEHKVRRWI